MVQHICYEILMHACAESNCRRYGKISEIDLDVELNIKLYRTKLRGHYIGHIYNANI